MPDQEKISTTPAIPIESSQENRSSILIQELRKRRGSMTPRQLALMGELEKRRLSPTPATTGDPDLDESISRSFLGKGKEEEVIAPGRFLLGAGAGLGESALGAYETVRKIPGFGALPEPPAYLKRPSAYEEDPFYQAGKLTETAAEMALPAGAARRGVGLVTKGLSPSRLSRGITAAGDIAAEAAGAGTVSGLRGGLEEAKEAALTAGAISAGAKAIFSGFRAAVPTAEKLYKASLPLTKIDIADVARAVDQGLKKGISLNAQGLERIKAVSGQLAQEIDAAIATSGKGQEINLAHLRQRFYEISDKYKMDPDYTEIMNGATGVGQELTQSVFRLSGGVRHKDRYLPAPRNRITLEEAQKLKQGYQRVFEKPDSAQVYGDQLARKKFALGLREEIERLAPNTKDPNEQLQGLIPLQKALEEFVAKDKRLLRHPWALMAGLAAETTGQLYEHETVGHAGLTFAVLFEALSHPGVLAAAAKAGYKTRPLRARLRNMMSQVAPKLGAAAIGEEEPKTKTKKAELPEIPTPTFGPLPRLPR